MAFNLVTTDSNWVAISPSLVSIVERSAVEPLPPARVLREAAISLM